MGACNPQAALGETRSRRVKGAQCHLSVVPARISLAKLESKLVGELDAHFRLKDRLDGLREEFRF